MDQLIASTSKLETAQFPILKEFPSEFRIVPKLSPQLMRLIALLVVFRNISLPNWNTF